MEAGPRFRTNSNFFKLMFMANAEREVGRNGRGGSAEFQRGARIEPRPLYADCGRSGAELR